jgi:hypothetical protein
MRAYTSCSGDCIEATAMNAPLTGPENHHQQHHVDTDLLKARAIPRRSTCAVRSKTQAAGLALTGNQATRPW